VQPNSKQHGKRPQCVEVVPAFFTENRRQVTHLPLPERLAGQAATFAEQRGDLRAGRLDAFHVHL